VDIGIYRKGAAHRDNRKKPKRRSPALRERRSESVGLQL
jgi:hypothetical protein